jgi:hypothetical protein
MEKFGAARQPFNRRRIGYTSHRKQQQQATANSKQQ